MAAVRHAVLSQMLAPAQPFELQSSHFTARQMPASDVTLMPFAKCLKWLPRRTFASTGTRDGSLNQYGMQRGVCKHAKHKQASHLMILLDELGLSRSHIAMCEWGLACCVLEQLRCWNGNDTAVVVLRPGLASSLKPWSITGLVQAVLAQGEGCRS